MSPFSRSCYACLALQVRVGSSEVETEELTPTKWQCLHGLCGLAHLLRKCGFACILC